MNSEKHIMLAKAKPRTVSNGVTPEEITDTARLAGLVVSERNLPALTERIAAIIRHMERIKELPVDGVPETARLTEEANIWREDTVEESLPSEAVFANGVHKDGYFIVSAVLKRDTL